ncbi:hypothetical protein IHE45_17G017400 [Dioscorea alata]|uniref:Uncharacterized protein n=1 Tax=Dioscorea alata TaxID=55571 RepID=A0ACB7UAS7_DIOAL|nr:hypothetical protein IHE45_17G017400 [Dioscorea alata]
MRKVLNKGIVIFVHLLFSFLWMFMSHNTPYFSQAFLHNHPSSSMTSFLQPKLERRILMKLIDYVPIHLSINLPNEAYKWSI